LHVTSISRPFILGEEREECGFQLFRSPKGGSNLPAANLNRSSLIADIKTPNGTDCRDQGSKSRLPIRVTFHYLLFEKVALILMGQRCRVCQPSRREIAYCRGDFVTAKVAVVSATPKDPMITDLFPSPFQTCFGRRP
jgi:hypothetical protein